MPKPPLDQASEWIVESPSLEWSGRSPVTALDGCSVHSVDLAFAYGRPTTLLERLGPQSVRLCRGPDRPQSGAREDATRCRRTKIRNLFVVPDAGQRSFFYGMNFEFSYEMPQFSPLPWALEIRPIIGLRNKEWEFIVNPIVDINFGPSGEADFAPAARLARSLGQDRFIGVEYYADYGKIGNVLPLPQQSQQLYAVTDFKVKDVEVELGAGYGFTPGSDRLIFKAIIGYAFPLPGKRNGDLGGPSSSSMTMGAQPRPTESSLLLLR